MKPVKNQEIGLYTVRLITRQPFRIGAYQDPMSDVSSPVAKLGGEVVVQGASLKGALRAQLETYLIQAYPNDLRMRPCIPTPSLSKDERALAGPDPSLPYRGENCGKGRGTRDLCPTCYLFGTQGLVGFVQVPYLYLASSHDVEEIYETRRDRATDTVASGANRTVQAIPADAVFEGEMEILWHDEIREWTIGQPRRKLNSFRDRWLENRKDERDAFIKEFVLDRLVAIPRLGGHISKGFGNVEIEVTPSGTKML